MPSLVKTAAVASALFAASTLAQSKCSTVLVPTYTPPSLAPGWTGQIVVNGLTKPRTIEFDPSGALLIVEAGKGITRVAFKGEGTCLSVDKSVLLVNQKDLNHGLALSNDGKTLYASSVESVFAWTYDPVAGTVGAQSRVVINGMTNNNLVTRTLLMSKKFPGNLIVSRGASEDLDLDAQDVNAGLGQIKAFDLTNLTASSQPYNFNTAGRRLGWGLRNSVGVAEHPVMGGIYSVENSIDAATRNGQDIHKNNPGEELNYHGSLKSPANQGGNYGYPNCFAIWDKNVPDNAGLNVGSQVAMLQNNTMNDTTCQREYVNPRLTLPAHYAPLGITFSNDGSIGYIAFHGAFSKTEPNGYRVSALDFDPSTGSPRANPDSHDALRTIVANPDETKCPAACFRPVHMAWDSSSRLFVTSDTTGEIYVLQKAAGTPTATTSGSIVTATNVAAAKGRASWGWGLAAVAGAAVML